MRLMTLKLIRLWALLVSEVKNFMRHTNNSVLKRHNGYKLLVGLLVLFSLTSCSPDIGSEKWCNNLFEKPKQEWTRDEVLGLTKHCIASD